MALPVALQLYTVRDEMEKDFSATLKAVKAMGYDGVELAGLLGHSADEFCAVLAETGLKAESAHVPLDDILKDIDGTIKTYKKIGCKFIVIPYVTEERRPGAAKFEQTIEEIKKVGKALKDEGMQLLYHNHDFEFVKFEGEHGLDVLYARTCPDCLSSEIDTCWVNVAGVNPSDYVRKYTGRAPVVHLKDFYQSGKLASNLYALIGIDEEAKEEEEKGIFEFRPVGHGMQDMPSILAAAVDAGAGWVVVEQDEPSQGNTRMESAKMSRDYLRTLGW
jgi:Sugar phosphate isomerases/epimerases